MMNDAYFIRLLFAVCNFKFLLMAPVRLVQGAKKTIVYLGR